MDHKKLQEIVNSVFTEAFIHTPLSIRLKDIEGECRELTKFTDLHNLREEAGDLLASLIQLCNESGWDLKDLILENEAKIKRRMLQYKGRGRKTNVAIFGGAFNPVTLAHIKSAQLVLDASGWADECWMLPCYEHMDGKALVSAEQRLEMLRLSTQIDGRIKVSDYEIKNKLHGETYHLLNKLIHDPQYEHCRFGFIIGQDRANTIASWFNSEELLKLDVSFIVIPRHGVVRAPESDWCLKAPHIYIGDDVKKDDILNVDMSSTIVRNLIDAGDHAVAQFVEKKTLDYIIQNKLYLK